MGCDIHLHIEVKINGKWEHWGAPSVQRWYELFEKMAGVRGDVRNAISPPKGLPEDMTTLTKLAATYDGKDAHSHSWLGTEEIMQLEDWLKKQARGEWINDLEHHILHSYLFGNSFTGHKRYPEDSKYRLDAGIDVQDVRFVFWFDN